MMTRKRMMTVFAVTACVLFGNMKAQAADGTWTGADSALWTNSLNWTGLPYPSDANTATFSDASPNTVLDVAGLPSIMNITFDSPTVAGYTLGAGAANSQTLVMGNNGTFRMNSNVATDQTFNAAVQLGPDTTTASYTLVNDKADQTLTVNNVIGTTGGTKTLNLSGSGNIAAGSLDKKSSSLNVNVNTTGTLTLNGNSYLTQLQINGSNSVINLAAGTTMTFYNLGAGNLMSAKDCTINGPGVIILSTNTGENYGDNGAETGTTMTINAKLTGSGGFEYWHSTYRGTILLAGQNDFTQNVIFNQPGTIACYVIGNKGSTTSNLGAGTTIIYGTGTNGRILYLGSGETTDRIVNLRTDGIIEQGGPSGTLNLSAPITVTSGTKTLTLQGSTAGTGEFSGAIRNDAGTINLKKEGTGTWTLSANSTYTGTTVINGGCLTLSGANGAISGSSSLTLAAGAELKVDNTGSANSNDRLRDAAPITLNGAILTFSNSGGAANYSESAGALTIMAGSNTLATAQADADQTNTLTLAGLSRVGGTVNFTGSGLGANDRNRIFITGQPAGMIGPWATVNGTSLAAYDSAKGVYAADDFITDIAAKGPDSVIPDNSIAIARISLPGDTGPITLEGAWTNSTLQVQQNAPTDATVSTRFGPNTNKTLLAGSLVINAGMQSLTIGEAEGDGMLAPLSAGGNLLLKNDEPASVLTLNAPVVNNTSASSLAKYGQGNVVLNGSNSYSGATVINEGVLAFGGSSTQTLSGIISGAGALTMQGTGRLSLSGANTFDGLTTVSSGTLLVQNNAALGSSVAGTVVESGATLDVGGSNTDQAMNLNAEQITVSGAGVNGRGAIINGSSKSQYNALRLVTLAGDTTVGGELSGARLDLRNVNGASTLTMNGHTLTKVGLNQFGLTGVTATPGGDTAAIDIRQGSVTIEVGTTVGGNSNNVMTVQGGAFFDLYQIYSPIQWSLVMAHNSRLYSRLGNVTNQNIWAGPVTLNGLTTFDGAASTMDTVSGAISGTGSIVKVNSSTTRLTSPSNTYTGTTAVNGGTLYVQTAGSLPGYNDGRVTVSAGATLSVYTDNGSIGWTSQELSDLNAASTFTAANAVLNIDTTYGTYAVTHDFPNFMGLTKQGANTLTLSGINTFRGNLSVNGGELAINGAGNHEVGTLYVRNASLLLTNSAAMTVYVTNNSAYVGYDAGNLGTMTVAGTAFWFGYPYTYNQSGGQSTLVIGQSGRGILTIQDNASVRQKLYLGNNTGSSGAVYQNGGKMHNWGGAGSDGRIGMSGYGYYELNSGTFTNNGYFQLGRNYNGVGILKQSNGAFEMGSVYGGQLGVSRGGTGVVYTAGGTFRTSSQLNLGESSDNYTIKGYAEFTTDGHADVLINGNVYMADRTNMFAAVNLNGGTLTANQFAKSTSRTGAVALVNFDGGAFRSRVAGNVFNTGAGAPDAVNIYEGGAAFDTTNFTCTIAVPLLAPSGSGVQSISVVPTAGYIGPPMVTIAGDGTGASAIATFDSASGMLTGIRITCPGTGYTTATVSLSGGGKTSHPEATASIGANVSGGVTKLGSGILSLTSTNTYAGATTVSNGTLRAILSESLPTGTDIAVAGGTLDLGGFIRTNGDVTATSGSIINGSLACDSLNITDGSAFSLSVPLSAAGPVQINGSMIIGKTLTCGSLTKTGQGALALTVPLTSGPIVIDEGTVKLVSLQPGLYEAPLAGPFNLTDDMSSNIEVRLTTRMANTVYTEPYNTTWLYKGYIWNRDSTNVTWTFAENFDDNVKLTVDTTVVITNGASWSAPTYGTITLTPGSHAFEARFGQGGGGGGPVNSSWWTTTAFGFGVDFLGRNQANLANYSALVDPGDGSLLTLTEAGSSATNLIDAAASLEMAAGAVLDLDTYFQTFASVSGEGIISNGTLAVSGAIMPGGDGTIGTLTVANSSGLSGTLLVDVGAAGASDRLAVIGGIDLSALILEIANPETLVTTQTYTVASVSGTRSGTFASIVVPDSRWHVVYRANGDLQLSYTRGTMLKLK